MRFDAVYVGHFKCNLRRIADYPNLSNYLRDLYQVPGVAETVNMDHIKRHYYMSMLHINPSGIVPLGPALDFEAKHDRGRFGTVIPAERSESRTYPRRARGANDPRPRALPRAGRRHLKAPPEPEFLIPPQTRRPSDRARKAFASCGP